MAAHLLRDVAEIVAVEASGGACLSVLGARIVSVREPILCFFFLGASTEERLDCTARPDDRQCPNRALRSHVSTGAVRTRPRPDPSKNRPDGVTCSPLLHPARA